MAWLAVGFMAVAAIAEGAAEKRAATSEAYQMRRRANTVAAQSQRAAGEEKRQADLVVSRAKAVAGASGLAVDSPGLKSIYSGIEAHGEYGAATALWNGEETAIGLEYAADNRESEGDAAYTAGFIKAGGTALAGYTSMAGQYSTPAASGTAAGPVTYRQQPYSFNNTWSDGKRYWGQPE